MAESCLCKCARDGREEVEISTGERSRLIVRRSPTTTGRWLVSVTPKYLDRSGEWRMCYGLMLEPEAARSLAPAIAAVVASIDGAPPEPAPTAEDREATRWP